MVEVDTANPIIQVELMNPDVVDRVQTRFNNTVSNLVWRAPNAIVGEPRQTDYGHPATNKKVTFPFRNGWVSASFFVDHGFPPAYTLSMTTPVLVEGLPPVTKLELPYDPHEVVDFKSEPFYRSLEIDVEAVNRLGNSGRKIVIAEYTAGGLLPPIVPVGRGKLQVFEAVNELFRGIKPKDPIYRQPFRA